MADVVFANSPQDPAIVSSEETDFGTTVSTLYDVGNNHSTVQSTYYESKILVNCLSGGLNCALALVILASFRVIGPQNQAARTFFCHMTCSAFLYGAAFITRGAALAAMATSFTLCKFTFALSNLSIIVYLNHMLFFYVEVYMSVRDMTHGHRSALSRRKVVLMSVLANTFWVSVVTFQYTLMQGSDKPDPFGSFEQCTFAVFDFGLRMMTLVLFAGLLSVMIVVHVLTARQVKDKTTRREGEPERNLTWLRNHQQAVTTMEIMLVIYTVCWCCVLAGNLLAMLDIDKNIIYLFNQSIAIGPLIANHIAFLARNQKVRALVRRNLECCRSNVVVPMSSETNQGVVMRNSQV